MAEFGLGGHLVERGVLTRAQLEDALQAQVVHGGRLGTNLVELGLLDLDQVAEQLADYFGVPLPPKEWLEAPDPSAIASLSRDFAESHGVLPLRLENAELHAAVIDPRDARLLRSLEQATGRSIRLYVLPELRLLYALERHLGIARPVRFVNVAKKLVHVRSRAAAGHDDRPEEVRLREALGIGVLNEGEDLIDESSFAALHQKLTDARERAAGGAADSAVAPVCELEAELITGAFAPGDGSGANLLETDPLPTDPASLEALLATAPDRVGAARVALALARLHVPAAALLVVHRGMVKGMLGSGGDLDRHIEAVLIPGDADSVLARVATGGVLYRGAPPATPLDARLLRALGRSAASEIAVFPIALRDRVVNLLYVDAGASALADTVVGALQALTYCIARSYERMIVSRRGV